MHKVQKSCDHIGHIVPWKWWWPHRKSTIKVVGTKEKYNKSISDHLRKVS